MLDDEFSYGRRDNLFTNASTSNEHFRPSINEDFTYECKDVLGRTVKLYYSSSAKAEDEGGWETVLKRGVPEQYLGDEVAQLQWRQEVNELRALDEATEDYRERFAQVSSTDGQRKLTSTEMLERFQAQKVTQKAGWLERISEHVRTDLDAYARGDMEYLRMQRDAGRVTNFTSLGQLLGDSHAGPRKIALQVLHEKLVKEPTARATPVPLNPLETQLPDPRWVTVNRTGRKIVLGIDQHPRPSTSVAPLASDLTDAFEDEVRAAAGAVGPDDESQMASWLRGAYKCVEMESVDATISEVKAAMRLIKSRNRKALTRRKNGFDELQVEGKKKVNEAELERHLGEYYPPYKAEQELEQSFDKLLEKRLTEVAETLAVLTIGVVTSRLMQPTSTHGEQLDVTCREIAEVLRSQYARDAVVSSYRHEQRECKRRELQAEAEGDEQTVDNARMRAKTLEKKIKEEIPRENTRTMLRLAQSMDRKLRYARDRDGREELTLEGGELAATHTHDGFNEHALEVVEQGGRTSHLPGWDRISHVPGWDSALTLHLGAYLLLKLQEHAFFQPETDEIAQARASYHGVVANAQAEHGFVELPYLGEHRFDLEDEPPWDNGTATTGDHEEVFRTSVAGASVCADVAGEVKGLPPLAPPKGSISGDERRTRLSSDDALAHGVLHDSETELPLRGAGQGLDGMEGNWVQAIERFTRLADRTGEGPREKGYRRQMVRAHPQLYDTLVSGNLANLRGTRAQSRVESQPMLAPPFAWHKPLDGFMPMGGEYHIDTSLVRTNSHAHERIIATTPASQFQDLLDGLNALSATPWRVNKRVLNWVDYFWEAYPTGQSFIVDDPSSVKFPEWSSVASEMEAPLEDDTDPEAVRRRQYIERKKQNEELAHKMRLIANQHSAKATKRLQLGVARDFVDETFYFPHNVDFRGRAYALGPHLQYLGDDLVRGLLQFGVAKPLGPNGMFWLKVQLANLYGKDKLSLDGRVAWSDEQIESGWIRRVDQNPGEPEAMAWWQAAEAPVQTLALIFELAQALEADEPERFESCISVHADGSCNGLQHYAALGRDRLGASQVNLVPADKPTDIYSGVREVVERKVNEHARAQLLTLDEFTAQIEDEQAGAHAEHEAAALLHAEEGGKKKRKGKKPNELSAMEMEKEYFAYTEQHRMAKLLEDRISRKIVKQTVMTTVYGVTFAGARDQIMNRLLDVHAVDGFNEPVERKDLPKMASYLAKLTFESLNENFKGATDSMEWLIEVAKIIGKETGRPIEWTTPLGWPVLQPYFKTNERRVKTVFHNMTVHDQVSLKHMDDNSYAPIKPGKQAQALPPNFVHSLDSSHMLRTATACREAGLTFAAVHDSYWTHACDMPTMNRILREEFVRLHESTDLKRMQEQWEQHYALKLPDPPEPGELDIAVVKDSTYFFS